MAWGNRLLDASRLVDEVTDWGTVWASFWLAGDLGQGEEVLFTTGQRGYWYHHPWPTGTERDTRAEMKCDHFLPSFPYFTRYFCFSHQHLLSFLRTLWKGHLWTWGCREHSKCSIQSAASVKHRTWTKRKHHETQKLTLSENDQSGEIYPATTRRQKQIRANATQSRTSFSSI